MLGAAGLEPSRQVDRGAAGPVLLAFARAATAVAVWRLRRTLAGDRRVLALHDLRENLRLSSRSSPMSMPAWFAVTRRDEAHRIRLAFGDRRPPWVSA